MRRAGATAAPRQDDRAKEALVAMPMEENEKQQVIARSTVVQSLSFRVDPVKKSVESASRGRAGERSWMKLVHA
eukprot:3188871-Prymnesium_polylepis.1